MQRPISALPLARFALTLVTSSFALGLLIGVMVAGPR